MKNPMSQADFIAAIMIPIPIAHLWLHALLPFWKKYPRLFYVVAGIFLFFSLWLVPGMARFSPYLFRPTPFHTILGWGAMISGLILILSSFFTLGPKRFLVWAVLRPDSVPPRRIQTGPFQFIPHPAYLGYLLIALGNLLTGGKSYLAGILFYTILTLPLIIWFEEHELKERTS